jgi:hypothetical protein
MSVPQYFNKNQRLWNVFPEYFCDPWTYFTNFIHILRRRRARFITMSDALSTRCDDSSIYIVLDHHIDHYPVEMEVLARWERDNGIASSIYLFRRVEASHPSQKKRRWSLEDLDLEFYRGLERDGFEIGYHQNAVGQVYARRGAKQRRRVEIPADIADEARAIFARDVDDLRRHFNIRTFIPHGGGEGNTCLTDVPEACRQLIWAYNARPESEGASPWENFNDSSGQDLKILRADEATYVVGRDALHVKAYTARPGLHHVLLHPGRFGKGMPYHQYSRFDRLLDDETSMMSSTLYPGSLADLPLSVPDLVREWEGERGRIAREVFLQSNGGSPNLPETDEKYYLLTDCMTVLRTHLARNPSCIGFLLYPQRMDRASRTGMRREKAKNRAFVSFPVPPDPTTLDHVDRTDRLFREQFSAFFNRVYTARPWKYLASCTLPLGHIDLRRLAMVKRSEITLLARLLQNLNYKCHMHLEFVILNFNGQAFSRKLRDDYPEVDERYRWMVVDDKNVLGKHRPPLDEQHTPEVKGIVRLSNCLSGADSSLPLLLTDGLFSREPKPFCGNFIHSLRGNVPPRTTVFGDGEETEVPRWATIEEGGEEAHVPRWTTVDEGGEKVASQAPACVLHHFASQLLFCRRVTSADTALLRARKLPPSWLNTIERLRGDPRNDRPFGGRIYREYVLAEASSELLYQFLARLMRKTVDPKELTVERHTIRFAWPWSYAARAAVEASVRTGEPRFAQLVLDTFEPIARRRDCDLGRVDECRHRALRSWGSTYYDDYAKEKGYPSVSSEETSRWTCNVTAAGRIAFPVALAIAERWRLQPRDVEISTTCCEYLHIVAEALGEFVSDYREVDEECGYIWRLERNEFEPLNHQNSYAEALIQVGRMTDRPEWVELGRRIATYFKRSIRRDDGGAFVWGYKGMGADHELRERQEIEDIAHAHLNISFARFCNRQGLVFDDEDMCCFARTFAKNVHIGDRMFRPRISPEAKEASMVMKPAYPDHYLAWIQLADYDPAIRGIVEDTLAYRYDLFPDNWFSGPVSAFAYAYRLGADPRVSQSET